MVMVMVMVQENRSFDHMLGCMKSIDPEINGVTGEEWNPISTSDPNSGRIFFGSNSEYVCLDPGHSFQAIREQMFGINREIPSDFSGDPPMNGFAQHAESEQKNMSQTVINGLKPEAVPVYKSIVSEFAVLDQWFASIPTSTQPNRVFVHLATSHGAMSKDSKTLTQGCPQKAIFESLEESNFTFRIYYQHPLATLYFRNLRRIKYACNFRSFDLEFKIDCEGGQLANYVVIEQRWFNLKIFRSNDDHPPHDVSVGQRFVKKVYEALRKSPQWNDLVFIIVYDEHGGFYDHVPMPIRGVPNPDGLVGQEPYNFKFDRLGVQFPAIVISPWIEKGTVVYRPSGPYPTSEYGPYPTSEYGHSSIPATVKKLFNLKDFLTKRDAWAGTFEHILHTRTTPRTDCPVTLPEPQKSQKMEPNVKGKLSEFQRELVQLAAQLNGNHNKDIYPDKLNARENGMDESEIPVLSFLKEQSSKNLMHKCVSCLLCNPSK
ncbi:hypothetical protein AMTRI_Chr03g52650 [Amborella trichopoda]